MDENSGVKKNEVDELSEVLDKILTEDHERRMKKLVDQYPSILFHIIIVFAKKLEETGVLPEGSVFDIITEGFRRWRKDG